MVARKGHRTAASARSTIRAPGNTPFRVEIADKGASALALSDVCAEFGWAVADAARQLAKMVEHYGDGHPIPYGVEIEGLRKACADVVRDPDDHAAVARLVQLAVATRQAHDTVPGGPSWAERHAGMQKLSALLIADVGEERAKEIADLIPAVAADTPQAAGAARRLKELLPKLGKAAYDIAIKVISDVASETAKKIMGLK